ncbi:MAG TPA: ATPase, T2SS/T4P/T4SS family [Acidobacteriota bacterium]|nr:ATPase, T2SS/T4P/T4SS family [Acidobacteriota bacterium]
MSEEYAIQCWYCLGEFDAGAAVWCSCDPKNPTKLCPYCLQCFCRASDDYKNRFWQYAPGPLTEERASLRKNKDRLGELLVRAQLMTIEDMLSALSAQSETGERLGQLLVGRNLITNEELDLFLQMQTMPVPKEFDEQTVDLTFLDRLNPEFCLQRKILPMKAFQGSARSFLVLAMADPTDVDTIEIVSRKTEMYVVPFYADEFAMEFFLRSYVPPGGARILEKETTDYQSVIRRLIVGAIKRHASDIHIEPELNELSVRYRIDGVLYKTKSPPKRDQAPLTQSLKKLAKMDLRKSGVPQSSKMFLRHGEKKYQLNILTFPNPHGESISIKVVDLTTFLRELTEIGFSEAEHTQVQLGLDSAHGLILISGPLMNGCSTTQYAMMRYLSNSNRKVMTLESPIFSHVKNIHQSEINPTVGFDFITGLNSIIRSDPDVIFLSDIPDAEVGATVCKIAARCVVVATVNALSASNAVIMLRELGASPSLLSQALSLVINQRLIRKTCGHCCEKMPISQSLLTRMGLTETESQDLNAYVGSGCEKCNYLGFNGRIAIFEVLHSTRKLAELIAKGASAKELEQVAVETGMVPLRAKCLAKINEGITTIEEFQKSKF